MNIVDDRFDCRPAGTDLWVKSGFLDRENALTMSHLGIACTKAVCNYILETYGRFPGTVDAMHLMWMMQAHHIDTQYYDRFFREPMGPRTPPIWRRGIPSSIRSAPTVTTPVSHPDCRRFLIEIATPDWNNCEGRDEQG